MEAKDTVMDDKIMVQTITDNPNVPMGQALIEKQAEISFKAGIKEVVEWLGLIRTVSMEKDGYVSHHFVAFSPEPPKRREMPDLWEEAKRDLFKCFEAWQGAVHAARLASFHAQEAKEKAEEAAREATLCHASFKRLEYLFKE